MWRLLAAYGLVRYLERSPELLRREAEARRQKLPERVILVRHGQSEGNIDRTLFRRKGDNLMELTELGSRQARAVGRRIKEVMGETRGARGDLHGISRVFMGFMEFSDPKRVVFLHFSGVSAQLKAFTMALAWLKVFS